MYRGPCIDVHERANKGEHGAREEYVRLERAGMLSFGSKVTEKGLRLMNGDEYLD